MIFFVSEVFNGKYMFEKYCQKLKKIVFCMFLKHYETGAYNYFGRQSVVTIYKVECCH